MRGLGRGLNVDEPGRLYKERPGTQNIIGLSLKNYHPSLRTRIHTASSIDRDRSSSITSVGSQDGYATGAPTLTRELARAKHNGGREQQAAAASGLYVRRARRALAADGEGGTCGAGQAIRA
eukprot:SAG11_NODE_4257_length_1983_cov_1.038196_1_plen_122_part_00